MAHITAKNAYKSLEERINKFPQGAPPSENFVSNFKYIIYRRRSKVSS